jgi:hypothetical protein
VGSSPESGHAEILVKVATVDTSGPKPTWTAVTPTLEGVSLVCSGWSSATLASVPSLLRSKTDEWPRAALSLGSQVIAVTPGAPNPGEPVTIEIEVKNPGTSDLFGAVLDVIVGDDSNGPALAHRQFVRSIPAGGSVTLKMDARFPRGYGVVSMLALTGSGETPRPNLIDESNWSLAAWRVVHPEIAPPDFANRMGAAVGCKPDCRVR